MRPINERVVKDGCLLVVSRKSRKSCSSSSAKNLTIIGWRSGWDASLASLGQGDDERILGGIAAIDPAVINIEAVEAYLLEKTKDKRRAERRGQRTVSGRRPNLHGDDGDAERRNRVDA